MKALWRFRLWAVIIGITMAQAQPKEQMIDRIVAVVDNDIILESELFQYVQFNAGSQAALESLTKAQVDSLKQLVLTELINQKVLLAKANEDTVTVPARDVDAELPDQFHCRREGLSGRYREQHAARCRFAQRLSREG